MNQETCRWGVLSTAGIARKNWQAILDAGNGRVEAVASRDVAKAQAFIDECQSEARFEPAPRAYGSYEALLADPNVDAVYVPLPTGLRKTWVIRAAEAKKHVLCEKPCAIHAADLREMIEACDANGVQFMDGVMYMHTGRLPALRKVLDDGESIGDLKRIATLFSFRAPEDFLAGNIRVHSELEPAGALGDLGWYTLRFTLWVMKYQMPISLTANMLSSYGRNDSPDAVPMEFSAELQFEGGISASFYVSFLTEHQQWAHVSGTKGNVLLQDFVLPYLGSELTFEVNNSHFDVRGVRFNMERHTRTVAVNELPNNHPTSQEAKLFRKFSQLVLDGERDPHWPKIALQTQELLDACLRSAREGGKRITL
ncbi:MAG: Gfo/Idh/MocA family oxidoreductase [Planctomycetes bacterium]|nr:Gfo/Idh/MocA family oxidoreductase [Planctomycetota bacterium]